MQEVVIFQFVHFHVFSPLNFVFQSSSDEATDNETQIKVEEEIIINVSSVKNERKVKEKCKKLSRSLTVIQVF